MSNDMAKAIEKDFAIEHKPVKEMAEAEKPKLEIVKEPKKERKPRAPKARAVEELVNVPLKNMTDKEKDLIIEKQKEELTIANNKINELKQNIEAAYKRARSIEDDYKAMEAYYKERMAFIANNTRTFYQSICLATKGDVK